MKRDLEEKLKRIVDIRELLGLLNVLVDKTDDKFELFSSYEVFRIDHGWRAKSITTNLCHDFYSLKSAASYCVFHCSNNIADAELVKTLDSRIGGATNTLNILKQLRRKPKIDMAQSSIYAAKMLEHEIIIKTLTPKIEQLYGKSRDHQIKKFNAQRINTSQTWERS